MHRYRKLIDTRSDNLMLLLKFLMGSSGIDYFVENEHTIYFNPRKRMCLNVDEEKLFEAKELVEGLPGRLEQIEKAEERGGSV